MPREVTRIPVSGVDAHVGAMGFLAVLAYPESIKKRDELVFAMKACFARGQIPRGRGRRVLPAEMREMENQQIDGRLDRAHRRIVDRLLAADMINRVLAAQGRSSLTSSAEWVARRINRSRNRGHPVRKAAKVRDRILGDGRPVLHLALALRGLLLARGIVELNMVQLMVRPDWLGACLSRAEGWRRCLSIPPMPEIRFDDADAIVLLPENP